MNSAVDRMYEKPRTFSEFVLKNPSFLVMAAVFLIGKCVANLAMGSNWVNALRSGLMGILLYTLGCYVIHMLTSDPVVNQDMPVLADRAAISKLLACFLVIALFLTTDVMYAHGVIAWRIPVWHHIVDAWKTLVDRMASSGAIARTGLIGWPYLIIYTIIPFMLLYRSGIKWRRPSWKSIAAASPFLLVYLAAFIIQGISVTKLLTLFFVLLWPALGEEFFFRGLMQRAMINVVNHPVTAIVITSLLFTVTHVPAYLLEYSRSPLLAFSSLLPIQFTAFFWGYGYYRIGVLWPWIMIHALSDLVGF